MLFCISLLPVTEQSNWLNTVHERYTITRKILHLFCVDNLKLVGKQEEDSKSGCKQLHGIQTWYVRRDCTQKRKTSSLVELTTWHQQRIQDLEQGKTGSEESEGMQHQKVKERLKKDYAMRLRMILISQLNSKNEITEIEDLDVQLLRYNFGCN